MRWSEFMFYKTFYKTPQHVVNYLLPKNRKTQGAYRMQEGMIPEAQQATQTAAVQKKTTQAGSKHKTHQERHHSAVITNQRLVFLGDAHSI